jgi:putative spermidine/putrescine transport system permease protein
MKPSSNPLALTLFTVVVCLFLVVPIAIIMPLSFSSGSFLSYPLPGLSLRWYETVLQPTPWLVAVKNSLLIACGATLLATVLGTMAAYGLSLGNFPGRGLVIGLLISPLIVPMVIVALGIYFLFARLGLSGTFTGMILAHAAIGAPYVVITVSASLRGFDRRLVLASASLGARPITTFLTVVLPLVAPGVASGALFAFMTSFDEVIIALFIASPAQFTLPRQLFAGLREQLDPSIIAISTLVILFTVALLVLYEILRSRAARHQSAG